MSRGEMGHNERLRMALTDRRLDLDAFAASVEVDVKTVDRWLRGRVPHRRNRLAVAALLGQDERYLWPEADAGLRPGATSESELIALYAQRGLVPHELWERLIEGTEERIDLLGYAMLHVPEQHPAVFDASRRVLAAGGQVRIALARPDGDCAQARDDEEQLGGALRSRITASAKYLVEGLRDDHAVELRVHDTPMYCSWFRFDDHALVTPHLYGRPGWQSPALHLRRLGPSGIFDNYAQHFEDIWATAEAMGG